VNLHTQFEKRFWRVNESHNPRNHKHVKLVPVEVFRAQRQTSEPTCHVRNIPETCISRGLEVVM